MTGIYKIISPTGRIYIGQSRDIEKRKIVYSYGMCKGQPRIYASLKKYGFKSHDFSVIEECDVLTINDRERYWQDFYNSSSKNGLNCMSTKTAMINGRHSDETKNKISKTKKGYKSKLKGRIGRVYASRKEVNIGRMVFNTETGIYYKSVTEACLSTNFKLVTFRARMYSRRKSEKDLKRKRIYKSSNPFVFA